MKSIVLSENPRIEFILGDCMDYMETLQENACYYAGHDFVGIELDEDYFEQAVNRFVKETKQKTLMDFLD